MNRVHSEAAAAAKEQRKNDKREKRKKHKDAKEDDCGASMAEEEAPKEKKQKQKQRKDKDEREEKKKLKPTVSIAVAGSIIDNAQSLELATLVRTPFLVVALVLAYLAARSLTRASLLFQLAGQIARAATVFRIDEVVVFDSTPAAENGSAGDGEESGARFLVRILEYLETPQYLRRRLFPMHKNLKFVGLLPPLDAPHHVRKHEWSEFREGVTLESDPSKGTLVDVGLSKNVLVEQKLEPGKRVTVAMGTNRDLTTACIRKVVPPSTPREQMGSYWGYKVRYTSNLSGVLKNSPFKEEYDHIIGTSEHGQIVNSSELTLPTFRHLLIAFGGLAGLEESIEEDTNLKGKRADDVFTSYFNTCPNQGSRTIRTEEALLISLQYFQDPIRRAEQKL
ncbi:hypothetical protein ZEAMMB73_Zm00001d044945 [Zea mays]|uniref:Methyltransferase n=1 Tax=Zea mays TaxID=4577 RepID=A0A1D6NSE1_MAIZE|nr:hypothetical protein ZEAMMB73_Zm00001d044945 [Zea mays]